MSPLACLLLLPLLGEVSCTFSLFLPGKSSEQYLQQPDYAPPQQQYVQCVGCTQQQDYPEQQNQLQQSSDYWPEGSAPSQEYQDGDPGFRFQAYQSSYRQHIQQSINPYSNAYQPAVYQQIPQHVSTYHQTPHHISTYQQTTQPITAYQQLPQSGVLPGGSQGVLPPSLGPARLSPPTPLPVYQLVTMGPELPVLVRLPNQQTAILPVRTVYSLPNFLERIVQRFQNYYSVYTPLEVLKVPRLNETLPQEAEVGQSTEAPASPTSSVKPDEGLANRVSSGSTEQSPTTTDLPATTTVMESEEGETTTATDSNDVQQETTTTQ